MTYNRDKAEELAYRAMGRWVVTMLVLSGSWMLSVSYADSQVIDISIGHDRVGK